MQIGDVDITTTQKYAEHGYPWQEWALLRAEAPVHWYESDDYAPFWALTRHADILTVSRRSDVFVNSGRLRIFSTAEDLLMTNGMRARTESLGWDPEEPIDMVFMDDPRHRAFRSLTARAFTPGALRQLEGRMLTLADRFVGELQDALERDGAADRDTNLVSEFSCKLPQAVICEMMGLPGDDWPDLLAWTNALVGAAEPPFLGEGELPLVAAARAADRMRDYFFAWMERCRREGVEGRGLTTTLLEAEVEGKPLTEQQLQGYFTLLVSAGSETTRNAITGGVRALLQHPEQLARLVAEPRLVPIAVEEILRWTSPVIQFARTAARDFELAGTRIRAGDDVAMFYPSANRDESVFEEPGRFDVTRQPNHHLAFGHGAHFCLGANLARQELRVMLRALLSMLETLRLAGAPELVPHLHVGGIRALPVRRVG